MQRITGGELLVQTLVDHQIQYVFSIIGGQMCTIYEAIRINPKIQLVTVHKESAVPLMACGYTAMSGVPAVAMTTVGAGVVYEVAGLIAAWYSYLPVVSISPQVQSWKMKPHQENLQACNQDEIFDPITKWNAIAYHWRRIPQLTHRAIREALSNTPGPTHLDIPIDILFQRDRIPVDRQNEWQPPAAQTRFQGALPGAADQIEPAIQRLKQASRPLAIVGQGLGRSSRYPGFQVGLNQLHVPTLLSSYSSGIMNGKDAAYIGDLTMYADSIAQADILLVMGVDSEILEVLTGNDASRIPIVQVESDPFAIEPSFPELVSVNADPQSFINVAIQAQLPNWAEWLAQLQAQAEEIARSEQSKLPDLAVAFEQIQSTLRPNEAIVVDGQLPQQAARAVLRQAVYGAFFLMDIRNMAGSGLPFAIGVKFAAIDRPVTLICDRDVLFRNLHSLRTAIDFKIEIRILCIDTAAELVLAESVLRGFGIPVSRFSRSEKLEPPHQIQLEAWLYASK